MADAVDLVRAYFHVNGYFTVSEYPVLERLSGGGYRTVTDLDLLAFRFAGAGPVTVTSGPGRPLVPVLLEPDPILGAPRRESDMIVAEVKEGYAELNKAARDPRVLEMALVRFGCCDTEEAAPVVQSLLRDGEGRTGHGHRIRLLAFGTTVPQESQAEHYTAISLEHVVSFLRTHLRERWDTVRHTQISDPALKFLSLIEKTEQGNEP